jgi:lambda family phage portal protein
MANKLISYIKNISRAILAPSSVGVKRKYEGADRGRRLNGFPLNNLSPNKDIGQDATLLRQRAKYLYQNSIYARRAINAIANGAVGTGILPTVKTTNARAMASIKAAWDVFGETTKCDFNGRLTFYGLQHLVTKTYCRDGECMVLRRRVPFAQSPTGMQYQVLEMEFLADYINIQLLPGGGYTLHGIQYTKLGKVEGYWLFNRHPSEWWTQPELYPADDVIHVFDVDYPAQGRGVTKSSTTIIPENELRQYEDAEIVAKKVQASHALFRVTNDDKFTDPDNVNADDYDSNEDLEKVEPGTIYRLYPGEDIKSNTPPTAQGAEDFRRSKQRNIASGYEVTYEMLTGDLSKVNFSSGRMGWIEHGRSIEHWQWNTIIPIFCDRAFQWFLDQLPITPGSSIISLPPDLKITWTTPRREMIDPVKETNALKNQARSGFKAFSEIVKGQGDDPEAVVKQIALDLAMFKKYGINAEWLPNLDIDIATPAKMKGEASRSAEEVYEEIMERIQSIEQAL